MRRPNVYTWFLLFVIGLYVGGCNKDEAPTAPQTDPQKARERVNQANQIFIPKLALLINSGGKDTAAYDMSAAKSLYGEALTADPDNLDGHFGYAATEVLLLNKDPEIRSMFGTPLAQIRPVSSALSAHPSAREMLESVIGKPMFSLSSAPLPLSPQNFYQDFGKAADSVPFSYYQNIVETRVLPVLVNAIAHLTRITQNPNYAYYINPQSAGGMLSDSIRIDLTEIYLFLAITQAANAGGSLLVAYNVDYNSRDQAAVSDAWQTSSPFLALRSNGAQHMKDTKSNVIGMATNLQNGITFLLNETPHPGVDLIRYRPQDVQGLENALVVLDSVKTVFTTPIILQGDFNRDGYPDSVAVSLSSFFDNAISDYKAKLPPYSVEVQQNLDGTYSAVLVWQATSYSSWIFPDPTFNGFFPGMTDASFKQTFGVGAQWNQRWVVGR